MEYALLYTFSTIPQTLAAALGVLAAFVLYRLQSDSQTLWGDAHELVSQFGADQWAAAAPEFTLAQLMGAQRFDSLLAELERRYATGQPPPAGSARDLAYQRFRASLRARRKIVDALKVAFWVTAVVIFGSVLELATARKVVVGWWWFGPLVLFLGLAALALCLWLYWLLLEAALWKEQRALGPH